MDEKEYLNKEISQHGKNDEENILPYNLIEIDTRVRERFLVLIL